jgi:hypothetical protein
MRIRTYIPPSGDIAELLRCAQKRDRPTMARAILARINIRSIPMTMDLLLKYKLEVDNPKSSRLTVDLPESHCFAVAVARYCNCLRGIFVFIAFSDLEIFAGFDRYPVATAITAHNLSSAQVTGFDQIEIETLTNEKDDLDSYVAGYFAEAHKTIPGATK